jgi:hypothetical protein
MEMKVKTANASANLPMALDLTVDDKAAIRRGEKAAIRIAGGATLREHLEVGDALYRLKRAALTEAGLVNTPITGRTGSAVNGLFKAALDKHPRLAEVDEKLRTASMKCVEHWPTTQMVLAELDPATLQTIGARALAERVAKKLTEGMSESDMPKEKKPKKADPWEGVRETHERAGVRYANRSLSPTDWDRVVNWLLEQGMPVRHWRDGLLAAIGESAEAARWAETPEAQALIEAAKAAPTEEAL